MVYMHAWTLFCIYIEYEYTNVWLVVTKILYLCQLSARLFKGKTLFINEKMSRLISNAKVNENFATCNNIWIQICLSWKYNRWLIAMGKHSKSVLRLDHVIKMYGYG